MKSKAERSVAYQATSGGNGLVQGGCGSSHIRGSRPENQTSPERKRGFGLPCLRVGMVLNRVATARAIGPKTADGIWRRSKRSASKAGGAVYLFSLHTIYRVLRISLMHLLQSVHQDRSDHFVQHGQRIISRIFFWSNCAHRAIRDRAASVGPNPPRRNPLRRRSKERLMATACSRGVPTAMHVCVRRSLVDLVS